MHWLLQAPDNGQAAPCPPRGDKSRQRTISYYAYEKRERTAMCREHVRACGPAAVRVNIGKREGRDRCIPVMGIWRSATFSRQTGCLQCRLRSLVCSMHAPCMEHASSLATRGQLPLRLATAAIPSASEKTLHPEVPSVHVWWACISDVGGSDQSYRHANFTAQSDPLENCLLMSAIRTLMMRECWLHRKACS